LDVLSRLKKWKLAALVDKWNEISFFMLAKFWTHFGKVMSKGGICLFWAED
jgi:hypothetical protein